MTHGRKQKTIALRSTSSAPPSTRSEDWLGHASPLTCVSTSGRNILRLHPSATEAERCVGKVAVDSLRRRRTLPRPRVPTGLRVLRRRHKIPPPIGDRGRASSTASRRPHIWSPLFVLSKNQHVRVSRLLDVTRLSRGEARTTNHFLRTELAISPVMVVRMRHHRQGLPAPVHFTHDAAQQTTAALYPTKTTGDETTPRTIDKRNTFICKRASAPETYDTIAGAGFARTLVVGGDADAVVRSTRPRSISHMHGCLRSVGGDLRDAYSSDGGVDATPAPACGIFPRHPLPRPPSHRIALDLGIDIDIDILHRVGIEAPAGPRSPTYATTIRLWVILEDTTEGRGKELTVNAKDTPPAAARLWVDRECAWLRAVATSRQL
ncbi:hypothetical protein R3P38DRAFT_3270876 [Favolaschia claudopus]|uniref:Uncharacterized protein n=1 Tax=Favolaschia claudopus TaxID=2862362 RepID=A0AAW0BBJ2_9AGAR